MRLFNTFVLVFASIGLLVLWGVFLAYYGRLPGIIPTHFGINGSPNGWGAKSTLLLFPLLGLAAYAMAIVFHYMVFPVRRRMAPIVQSLVFLELSELVWFWLILQWETIRAALGYAQGLDSGFNILFAIITATAAAIVVAAIATRSWDAQQRLE